MYTWNCTFGKDVFAMDKNKYEAIRLRMERCAEALRRNNFAAECVDSKEEALELVEELIPDGATVAVGGSVTLSEVGVLELLSSGRFNYLDRYAPGLTPEERREVFVKSFGCDYYLCSANAVTENGELYNVDGTGNRVAAMLFGPEKVIVIAGCNKLVKDLDAADERVKAIAAPANAIRLDRNTPCTKTGRCADCRSEGRICANKVVFTRQTTPGRITVILVAEELGY